VAAPPNLSDQSPQGLNASTGCGATDGINGKEFHSPTDQFPVPVATDQHGYPGFPTQKGHHQQAAMPEGDDQWSLTVFPQKRLDYLPVDLLDPHREPKELDQPVSEKRNQKEQGLFTEFLQKRSRSLGHSFSSDPLPRLSGTFSQQTHENAVTLAMFLPPHRGTGDIGYSLNQVHRLQLFLIC
jgi:hypothetical protein